MKRSQSGKDEQGPSHHPFGGCDKLFEQYRTIGTALMKYERTNGRFGSPSPTSLRAFRQEVVFIPVEVLESYLDDLLNLSVRPETLSISSDTFGNKIAFVALIGLVFAITVGLFAASTGANFFLSFMLTACLASPFAVLWHFSPREGTVRRMSFAQLLTHEISKRRGGGKKNGEISQNRSVFEGLLGQPSSAPNKGAVSRTLIH